MRSFLTIAFLLGTLAALPVAGEQSMERGAVILAAKRDPLEIRHGQGEKIAPEKIRPGALLTDGHAIATGEGGEAILLLSNGTLVTVGENTTMKLEAFLQEPFDAAGTLAELKEEPSASNILIDLEIGDIVVRTKKLNAKSNFEITTPVGTAGIRGTQFSMNFTPGRGMLLDVTESTVSFRPRAGGALRMVGAGGGLTAPPRMKPAERPVTPQATRRINRSNDKAVISTRRLPMTFVRKSMSRATNRKPPVREEFVPRTRSEGQPDESPDGREPPPGQPGPDKPDSEDPQRGAPDGTDGRPRPDAEPGEQTKPGPEAVIKPDGTKPAKPKNPLPVSVSRVSGSPERKNPARTSEVLDNIPLARQARKMGRLDEMTAVLAKYDLDGRQADLFFSLSAQAQEKLLGESPEVTARVLRMDGLSKANAYTFFTYSDDTRAKILALTDEAAVQALEQGLAESLLTRTLTESNLQGSAPDRLPGNSAPQTADKKLLGLGAKLKESGNAFILEELEASSSGAALTDDQIAIAEVADVLASDYSLTGAAGTGPTELKSSQVIGNPFYKEISALYRKLETDQLVAGETTFVGGANLVVPANAQALSPYLSGAGGKTVVLSASGTLVMEGDLSWGDQAADKARLVVMSAGEAKFSPGMTLSSATSDLVLSSRSDLSLDAVKLLVSQEATVQGMRDVSLQNVDFGANAKATVRAARNLNVDGMTFSRPPASVLMEATTLRLSNVNFPATSTIRLNSLKGPIDGKYPNFGTAIPAAQQLGRVNFIQNVSSGGNPINTRQAFDHFGGNLKIGRTGQP